MISNQPAPDYTGKPVQIVSVKCIWSQAPHNAFTDLIRFRDRWWCVFREAKKHTYDAGSLRIITSSDGDTWESAALIQSESEDLRDGKLSITPDGDMLLTGAGVQYQSLPRRHQTYTWRSRNGAEWEPAVPIGDVDNWLWRVTWHQGVGYGIGYSTGSAKGTHLYRTTNGYQFEHLVENLYVAGFPNESSLVFLADNTAVGLLRRDEYPGMSTNMQTAQLGVSKPPYTAWLWKDTDTQIGGPHMLLLPDNRIISGVRLYDKRVRTSLCWVNVDTAQLTEFAELPSRGDTSYPGLVWHDGLVWVSYYSSHEGKTSIYLAKVAV